MTWQHIYSTPHPESLTIRFRHRKEIQPGTGIPHIVFDGKEWSETFQGFYCIFNLFQASNDYPVTLLAWKNLTPNDQQLINYEVADYQKQTRNLPPFMQNALAHQGFDMGDGNIENNEPKNEAAIDLRGLPDIGALNLAPRNLREEMVEPEPNPPAEEDVLLPFINGDDGNEGLGPIPGVMIAQMESGGGIPVTAMDAHVRLAFLIQRILQKNSMRKEQRLYQQLLERLNPEK